MPSTTRAAVAALIPVVLALALAWSAPASAGTVSLPTAAAVRYDASPGETNNLSMQMNGEVVRLRDTGAPIHSASPECVALGHRAICLTNTPFGFFFGDVFAGDGNDHVTVRGGEATIYGGSGNDVLGGGRYLDHIYGEAGNDSLYGNGLVDFLEGGDGNDHLSGGDDPDTLDGGPGDDLLDGGHHWDTLHGGDGDDTLVGGAGFDTLDAGAGADRVLARDGYADDIFCGPGLDVAQIDVGIDTNVNDCDAFLP
jgi:Ca2+-binding RTX toxin-like protein